MLHPLLHDHPFIDSNALMTQDSTGQYAFYHYITDFIASNQNIHEVRSFHGFHEVIHRASSHYGKLTNSFSMLRKLAGISHALNMSLMVQLDSSNANIKGRKLADLKLVNASHRDNETISTTVQKLSYLESVFDMCWRATVPIAELIAIDFSHDLNPINYFYFGWDIQHYYQVMSKNDNMRSKLDQLKRSIKAYPQDFGGYHIKYGSFSNAMETVFMAYNSIADNELRYPILELALHILFVNKNGQISINDPLEVIIRESSNSHTTPKDELLLKMASDRVEYGLLGELVPYMLTRQLLSDVPQHISSHKNLTLALMYLMSEQKSGDLNSLTRPILTPTWVESLSRSFIRADVSKNDRLTLELNPNYVIAAHYRILNELDVRDKTAWAKFKAEINTSLLEQSKFADLWQNLGLHSDWWRRLALLEALRTSLKFGKPLVCPYKGWQFEKFEVDALKNYPLKCDERCIIRYWLKKLKNRTEIVGSNATCEP